MSRSSKVSGEVYADLRRNVAASIADWRDCQGKGRGTPIDDESFGLLVGNITKRAVSLLDGSSDDGYRHIRERFGVDPVVGQRITSLIGGTGTIVPVVSDWAETVYIHVVFDSRDVVDCAVPTTGITTYLDERVDVLDARIVCALARRMLPDDDLEENAVRAMLNMLRYYGGLPPLPVDGSPDTAPQTEPFER